MGVEGILSYRHGSRESFMISSADPEGWEKESLSPKVLKALQGVSRQWPKPLILPARWGHRHRSPASGGKETPGAMACLLPALAFLPQSHGSLTRRPRPVLGVRASLLLGRRRLAQHDGLQSLTAGVGECVMEKDDARGLGTGVRKAVARQIQAGLPSGSASQSPSLPDSRLSAV